MSNTSEAIAKKPIGERRKKLSLVSDASKTIAKKSLAGKRKKHRAKE